MDLYENCKKIFRRSDAIEFKKVKDIKNNGSKYFDVLKENDIDKQTLQAFKGYTGIEYSIINAIERGSVDGKDKIKTFKDWDRNSTFKISDKRISSLKKLSALLSKEIEKHTIKKDLYVYKRISLNRLKNMLGKQALPALKKIKGCVIYDPGFMSTTLFSRVGKMGILNERKGIQLRIKVPAGSKGVYISNISTVKTEHELLLPKGVSLEITRVNLINNIINCTVIPSN